MSRNAFSWLIAFGPVFAVAYFARIGSTSLYIFDVYSVVLLWSALAIMPSGRLVRMSVLWAGFVTASLVGLVVTVATVADAQAFAFIPPILRYYQLFLVASVVVWATNNAFLPYKRTVNLIFLLAAIYPLLYGLVMLNYSPDSVLRFNRFASYFDNPNFVGTYICIAIPAVNLCVVRMRSVLGTGLGILFYAATLFSLIYSGSNGGWLLAAASLAFSLLSLGISSRAAVVLFSILAMAMLFVVTNQLAQIQTILSSSDIQGVKRTGDLLAVLHTGGQISTLGSGQERNQLLRQAFDLYLASPVTILFGVGLGQSSIIIGAAHSLHVTAHNAFMVLLLETGCLGTFFFFTAIIVLLKRLGTTLPRIGLLMGYLLSMLGTPAVYLPFLWGMWVFGWHLTKINNHSALGRKRVNSRGTNVSGAIDGITTVVQTRYLGSSQ